MVNSKQKGNHFERCMARDMSLWWSNGKRDDIFWRTNSSGARATQRGKHTASEHGDLLAMHPSGQGLLDHVCIELKCGKSRSTASDMLDKPTRMGVRSMQDWEKFISQAAGQAEEAGVKFWMVLHRRNGREIMLYIPKRLHDYLWIKGKAKMTKIRPQAFFISREGDKVYGFPWEAFKKRVKARHFARLSRPLKVSLQ